LLNTKLQLAFQAYFAKTDAHDSRIVAALNGTD
jgi:hypothetical protein